MAEVKIKGADLRDINSLTDIFFSHLQKHPEYISHGEIQMGVAISGSKLSPAAKDKWMEYICREFESGRVWKAMVGDEIVGLCITDIEEDGDKPFGMICDVLVKEEYRGQGIGGCLLDTAISWLHENGIDNIFLESGKENHNAHEFFKSKGFGKISEVYKLR